VAAPSTSPPQEQPPPIIIEAPGLTARPISPFRRGVNRFLANKAAVVSLAILVIASLLALLAPVIAPYDPMGMNMSSMLAQPSAHHWLGTDILGRDFYTRVLYSMRGPLGVAFTGAALCVIIGAITGILAGYAGGWIDGVLSRITEMIFVIPGLLFIILMTALFGSVLEGPLGTMGRYIMIMFFLATDSWPVIMRLTRAQTLSMKETQFIEAAVVTGTSTKNIIMRHLLPNMGGILLVQGGLFLPGFLFATAVLGLFGLGAQGDYPDLGAMIDNGTNYMATNPVLELIPTVVMTVLIVASTFLGDGLRDAFDTRAME
jgi:peptide/nickel transport system permease protein